MRNAGQNRGGVICPFKSPETSQVEALSSCTAMRDLHFKAAIAGCLKILTHSMKMDVIKHCV